MSEKTPAQRLAEEIAPEFNESGTWVIQGVMAEVVIERVLAEIRRSRDEIGAEHPNETLRSLFWVLFNDGAQFGPPKKPPTFTKRRDTVEVRYEDGEGAMMTERTYRAIQSGPKPEEL